MVQLQIPKGYFSGFREIAKADEEKIQSVVNFLNELPVGSGPSSFNRLFQDRFTDTAFASVIASTIYSFGGFQSGEMAGLTEEDMAASLADSCRRQIGEPKLTEEEFTSLQKNLTDIFTQSKTLSLTFKAFKLMTENNSVFRDTQVITDIRLLFNNNLQDKDRHAIVIHQVKLQLQENEKINDYFITLNSNDLQRLKRHIERAEEKEKLIRENYSDSITFVNITE